MQVNSPPFDTRSPQGALGPYLRAIRVHRLLVIGVTLAALVGSLLWLAVRSETYEATAQLLVSPLSQDDETFLGLQVLRDSGDPTRTVQTAASLVDGSRLAAERAARQLGDDWTGEEVLDSIQVEAQGESLILAVVAQAGDPETAARLANRFTAAVLAVRQEQLQRQVTARIADIEARLERLGTTDSPEAVDLGSRLNQLQDVRNGGDPTLILAQRATPPDSPLGASALLVILLALIGGLALGTGAAVLVEMLDRRIVDEEEATALYPLPVLARVPEVPQRWLRLANSGAFWAMPPAIREAFRTLAVQLEPNNGSSRAIMITSGSTGDGKTSSAINIAVSLAAAGRKVILMDFDVRKPDIQRALKLEEQQPLMSLLNPDKSLYDLLVPAPHLPSLAVLATESVFEGEPAMLESLSRRLPELLEEARDTAEYVVLDTAPLGEVSDALRIAHAVDDIIIVTRLGHTDRPAFEAMRDLLERTGEYPRGMLLIGTVPIRSSYYEYGLAGAGRARRGGGLGRLISRGSDPAQ